MLGTEMVSPRPEFPHRERISLLEIERLSHYPGLVDHSDISSVMTKMRTALSRVRAVNKAFCFPFLSFGSVLQARPRYNIFQIRVFNSIRPTKRCGIPRSSEADV